MNTNLRDPRLSSRGIPFSTRKVFLLGSLLIAVLLLGAAFYFSGPHAFFANAQSSDELLKAYASKDTDGDGLPDWLELLYGTDPNNASSVKAGITDKDAVDQGLVKPKFESATSTPASTSYIPGKAPATGSLTDRFAQQFFGSYLLSRTQSQTAPSASDLQNFVTDQVNTLSASSGAHYSSAQIRTLPDGADALKTYAQSVENVFALHQPGTAESELLYFSDAVTKNDASALASVKKIGESYTAVAAGLATTPVPISAASAELRLANAFAQMGAVVGDMAVFDTDPLRGLVGVSAYQDAVNQMAAALAAYKPVLDSEQVTFAAGEAGYSFYSTVLSAESAMQKPSGNQ